MGLGVRLGHGQLKEGQRNGGPLHRLFSAALLVLCGSALHADASVDGLVASQVVAVLELLAADLAYVSHTSRAGHRLHWRGR